MDNLEEYKNTITKVGRIKLALDNKDFEGVSNILTDYPSEYDTQLSNIVERFLQNPNLTMEDRDNLNNVLSNYDSPNRTYFTELIKLSYPKPRKREQSEVVLKEFMNNYENIKSNIADQALLVGILTNAIHLAMNMEDNQYLERLLVFMDELEF